MRKPGRWLVGLGLGVGCVVGAAHLAMPAHESPTDGPADPLLSVRRPVVKLLEKLHLVRGVRYLPSHRGTRTWYVRNKVECVTSEGGLDRFPVYRGLLWPVGDRIRWHLEFYCKPDEDWRSVRLCFLERGCRFVAGEAACPDGRHLEVSGYVPRSASAIWIEGEDRSGAVHSIESWGDPGRFWKK